MEKRDDREREMTRAVDRLGEIVGELTLAINRFLWYQRELENRWEYSRSSRSDPYLEDRPREGMPEGETLELAMGAHYIVAWDPNLTGTTLPFPVEVVRPPELLRGFP